MEITVVADGFSYLECPRWHRDRLWVSDFYTHQVLAIDAGGAAQQMADIPEQPAGIGWLPDGDTLIVSMKDRKLIRRADGGELTVYADLSGIATWHLNDMVVDPLGRAYVGNFGFDLMSGAPLSTATLVRVDPDGTVTAVAEELLFPNGMVITPDGGTLVVAETLGRRLTAFDIGRDGALHGRRDWAGFGGPGARDTAPDGICLDAEGAIWVADAHGHRLLRVREGGEILQEISTGALAVFACMLGGADGRTLFACAAPSFAEHERRETRDAVLLTVDVAVPHAGLP